VAADRRRTRGATGLLARDALVQQNEDAVEREGRPHAHLDERRAIAVEWVLDELDAQMHVRGAGLAFGARLQAGGGG
jgi:hypothetical protein